MLNDGHLVLVGKWLFIGWIVQPKVVFQSIDYKQQYFGLAGQCESGRSVVNIAREDGFDTFFGKTKGLGRYFRVLISYFYLDQIVYIYYILGVFTESHLWQIGNVQHGLAG